MLQVLLTHYCEGSVIRFTRFFNDEHTQERWVLSMPLKSAWNPKEKEKDLKQFKNFYDFSSNKLQIFGLEFLPNILQPFFFSLRLPANFSVGLYKI